tara:strand:+ start:423 stop:686 length:264 start_codon:yes stop_codon:yes gene_type:complete
MSVFIIRFLPIIVFIILVLLWYLLARNKSKNAELKNAPWFVFIIIAIVVFGLTLVLFRFIQFGDPPGGTYIPPKSTEEGIEPGHVER